MWHNQLVLGKYLQASHSYLSLTTGVDWHQVCLDDREKGRRLTRTFAMKGRITNEKRTNMTEGKVLT